MNEEENKPEDSQEKINLIVQNIFTSVQKGYSKSDAATALVSSEIGIDEAREYVNTYYDLIVKQIESTTIKRETLVQAVVAGLLSSIISALIWMGIVVVTDREIGYVALGLGWLVGLAIKFGTGGKVGMKLQVIAAGFSLFGIFIAKYFTFYYFVLKSASLEEMTGFLPKLMGAFLILPVFFENIGSMLSFYDILWVVLAASTAWSTLKSE